MAEYRDTDTGEHVLRVQKMTDAIVQQLKKQGDFSSEITPAFEEMMGMASILHDVGKVGTPDHILFKPGKHTAEERVIMEQHVNHGGRILEDASLMVEGESYLSLGVQIAMGHHEHFDGKGYPKQLIGEEIPLSARIVALTDVVDALLHKRPYKEPWPLHETIAYIRDRAGKQFDPRIVRAFMVLMHEQYPELNYC
jgi:response regulator RpfG family c-di-GMP phosphodiesterase